MKTLFASLQTLAKRLYRKEPPAAVSDATPAEFLAALPAWDGKSRNRHWLSDYLGAEKSEYTSRVGQFFLRAMVSRALEPGCKFEHCLILEGTQGCGKSQAVEILSAGFFGEYHPDSGKDGLESLKGRWLYEVAELGALMRDKSQKSFLSRQDDEYRPPYSKRIIKVPRQSVFIGTTNEKEYLNKDATDTRRFWPVTCGRVDPEGLRNNLEQMFAEALCDYRAGLRYWPSREEERELFAPEQQKRSQQNTIAGVLEDWVMQQTQPFTLIEAGKELGLTSAQITPAMATRIGIALRKMGCCRIDDLALTDPTRGRTYSAPGKASPLTSKCSSTDDSAERKKFSASRDIGW